MSIKLQEDEVVDGRYRVIKPLGRGGFASVYEALHLQLDRPAALKVLDPVTMGSPETFRARFLSEAKIAANLDHPNVVRIFDFGFVSENQPYIAMEKLNGMDLDTYLVHCKRLAPDRVKRLFLPVLDALRVGHDKGVVHKDLKPANIFFVDPDTPHERLVILDYGIARIEDDSPRLTQTGAYTGTPAYMPPEYIQKRIVAPTFDVYQFGLMYLEVLIGRPVIQAATSIAAMVAHVQGEHDVPFALAQSPAGRVLMRAIEVDYQKRYQNAGELLAALSVVDVDPSVLGEVLPTRVSGAPVMTVESQQFGEGDTADSQSALPAVEPPSTSQHLATSMPQTAKSESEQVVGDTAPRPKKSMLPIIAGLVGVTVLGSGILCASGAVYYFSGPDSITVTQTRGGKTHTLSSSVVPAFAPAEGEVAKLTHYFLVLRTVSALFIFAENYKRTASNSRDSVLAPSSIESLGALATSQLEAGRDADPKLPRVDAAAKSFADKLRAFITVLADIEAFYGGIGDQSDTYKQGMNAEFKQVYRGALVGFNKLLKRTGDAALRHAARCMGDDDPYFVAVCGVVEASLQLGASALQDHRGKAAQRNMALLRQRLGALKKAQKRGAIRLNRRFQSNPTAASGVYEQGKDLLKTAESLAETPKLTASERHEFVDGAYFVFQRYSVARQFGN